MKRLVFALSLGLLHCAGNRPEPETPRQTSQVTYAGGDGSSCETAILIHGASNEQDGVAAEYDWLKKKFPGFAMQRQSLIECGGHPADKMEFSTADGQARTVLFDINEYFGKM